MRLLNNGVFKTYKFNSNYNYKQKNNVSKKELCESQCRNVGLTRLEFSRFGL